MRQKKEQQKAENAEGAAGGKKKKVTAAQLRVQKGVWTTIYGRRHDSSPRSGDEP